MSTQRINVKPGPHSTGKTGKMVKTIPVRENRKFGNFAKTQGILSAQVVNFLILKIQDIAEFFKVSFTYEIVEYFQNCLREDFQSDRENTGHLLIGFEWGPC